MIRFKIIWAMTLILMHDPNSNAKFGSNSATDEESDQASNKKLKKNYKINALFKNLGK